MISSYIPPAFIALTNTYKVTLKTSEITGGNPNVMLVPVVCCHCKMSQAPSTVPTETSLNRGYWETKMSSQDKVNFLFPASKIYLGVLPV